MLQLDAEGVAGFFLVEEVGPCLAGCLAARNVASPTARWGELGTPKSSSDSSAFWNRTKPIGMTGLVGIKRHSWALKRHRWALERHRWAGKVESP